MWVVLSIFVCLAQFVCIFNEYAVFLCVAGERWHDSKQHVQSYIKGQSKVIFTLKQMSYVRTAFLLQCITSSYSIFKTELITEKHLWMTDFIIIKFFVHLFPPIVSLVTPYIFVHEMICRWFYAFDTTINLFPWQMNGVQSPHHLGKSCVLYLMGSNSITVWLLKVAWIHCFKYIAVSVFLNFILLPLHSLLYQFKQ